MTTSVIPLELSAGGSGGRARRSLPVLPVDALLRTQQTLTAVERFAAQHDANELPLQAKYYRDLLPTERPRKGEQYAFQVDLDACTGCKACVTACHTLNGLDEQEMWRTVGLLQGGTSEAPALQTVTTSCHHCLEPACLIGCPVQAYEKDEATGIVRHLDDQCFGCQYCTLMCPYDAPKYNKQRGVVRKCDMCSDRLSHGEAPACVQACPNQAIAIRIVDQEAIVQASEAQSFLPGAPAPDHTLPSTRYTTKRALPSNLLPADFYTTSPQNSHPPLVIMLVLTQLSVGAFTLGVLHERMMGSAKGAPLAQTALATSAAIVALFASVFHLGRPWLAWRAFIGLRTSWLSREAVAFGGFAGFAMASGLFAAAPLIPHLPARETLFRLVPYAEIMAALSGLSGVFFSVMVYVATKRAQWSAAETGVRFFGTMIALGAASLLAVASMTTIELEKPRLLELLSWLIIGTTSIKLLSEARILRRVLDKRHSALKVMAILMLGALRRATLFRFALAIIGGLLLPLSAVFGLFESFDVAAIAVLLLLLGAELLERYLFFRAAPASRMPGAIP